MGLQRTRRNRRSAGAAFVTCRPAIPSRWSLTLGAPTGAHWLHHRHLGVVRAHRGLDIAPDMQPTPREILLIISYQWWLRMTAFVLGHPLGDWMTRRFAKMARTPRQGRRTELQDELPLPLRGETSSPGVPAKSSAATHRKCRCCSSTAKRSRAAFTRIAGSTA